MTPSAGIRGDNAKYMPKQKDFSTIKNCIFQWIKPF